MALVDKYFISRNKKALRCLLFFGSRHLGIAKCVSASSFQHNVLGHVRSGWRCSLPDPGSRSPQNPYKSPAQNGARHQLSLNNSSIATKKTLIFKNEILNRLSLFHHRRSGKVMKMITQIQYNADFLTSIFLTILQSSDSSTKMRALYKSFE